MDEDRHIARSTLRRVRDAWSSTQLWMVFLVGLIGVTAAISLPIAQDQSTFNLQVGDVSSQDILAPFQLTYTSEVLTNEARQRAAAEVPNVYDPPDSQLTREQLDRLNSTLEFVDSVRADEFASEGEKIADLLAMSELELDPETAQAILDLSDARWQAVKLETNSVLQQVMRTEIRPDRLEQVRRSVPALVSISMPQDQASLVAALAGEFVAPNSLLNEAATEAARQRAREAVTPVSQSFAEGETIVGRGQVVSSLDLEALQAYNLLEPPDVWREVAVRALLVTLLGFSLALFTYRAHPDLMQRVKLVSTLTLMMVVFTFGMQFMIPGRTVLPYIFPAATLPMLAAVLFGPGMGIMTSFVLGALAGFMGPRGLELGLYVAVSGMMGSLLIGEAERLGSFFWAGLASALGSVAIIIIFRLPDPATDALGKATLVGAGVLSGLLSASLAFGLLLLLGAVLGITTNLQLLELARPDHPLLQNLLRNAPGTYQHSLQVANLAEQAARAIGANPLLTRVGALYHDIGKANRPQFFIENQVPGQNIHEQLDPATSASVILAHVSEGQDLARKHRLPQVIQNFIPEHHGRLEVSFQYQAALEAAGGDESNIDRKHFTYSGPRPRSRETALLMLADGVEARARAEMPKDEAEIDQIVRWVIQERVASGQLDRTDLTLKDLDTIRRSFVNTLKGMYHPRIRYPDAGETKLLEGAAEGDAATAPTPAAREA